jgi:hypothetical protein
VNTKSTVTIITNTSNIHKNALKQKIKSWKGKIEYAEHRIRLESRGYYQRDSPERSIRPESKSPPLPEPWQRLPVAFPALTTPPPSPFCVVAGNHGNKTAPPSPPLPAAEP